MRYISIFSGIEAASVAWEPLGWEPVAFSEIDEFPSAVLRARYPNVPNLGDITKVDWSPYRGTVDLVVGGSPCQAFSIAGKRQGLMDARGQLMLEYVRAVAEIEPKWFIWENVCGALSQDRGRAFGTLLREMDELGYGMAWRVLDAQFFGVAQRRRRVFLVGCARGGAGTAAAVLFEPESVSGNTTSSKQKREALAADARSGPAGAGESLTPWDNQGWRVNSTDGASPTLSEKGSGSAATGAPCVLTQADGTGCLTPWDVQSKRVYSPETCGPTLNQGAGMTTTPSVLAFVQNQRDEVRLMGGDGQISGALAAARYSTHKQETLVAEPVVMASAHTNAEIGEGGVSPTLIAHIAKDAPVLAMERTCFPPSAQQTAASNSSTTNQSTAEDSCSTQDRSGPDPICMADDNAHAAIDENLSGSLKVGGGQPFVALRLTETM